MGILFDMYDGFITACEDLSMSLDDMKEDMNIGFNKIKRELLECSDNEPGYDVNNSNNDYDDDDEDDEDRSNNLKKYNPQAAFQDLVASGWDVAHAKEVINKKVRELKALANNSVARFMAKKNGNDTDVWATLEEIE